MLEFARLFKVNSLSAVRADVSFAAVSRASRFHRRNIFRGGRCVRVRKKTYLFERDVLFGREFKFYRRNAFGQLDKSVFVRKNFLFARNCGNLYIFNIAVITCESHGERSLPYRYFFACRKSGIFLRSVKANLPVRLSIALDVRFVSRIENKPVNTRVAFKRPAVGIIADIALERSVRKNIFARNLLGKGEVYVLIVLFIFRVGYFNVSVIGRPEII